MNNSPDPDPFSDAFADPFAAPAPAKPVQPTQGGTPAAPHVPISERLKAAATANTYQGDEDASAQVPCPCVCSCGNLTDKTYAEIQSNNAARHLRCAFCAAETHFGPRWTSDSTTTSSLGVNDREVIGDRGTSFVIRHHHITPEEAADDREIAERLERDRRDAARDRWLNRLPERWQMPYDDNEQLEPQIEDRLERLGRGAGGHGTSLICIGPFGSGKTWVAYTYARAAVDRNLLWPQEIRIGTEAEIMEPVALASPWKVAEKSAELLRPELKLLIIDDVGALGTYKDHENRFATWTKVVNWAYEHKRALVLTTNRTLGTSDDPPTDLEVPRGSTEASVLAQWRAELLETWIGPTAYERLKHMVGADQVFRDENKRGEMTARWEAEYQRIRTKGTLD